MKFHNRVIIILVILFSFVSSINIASVDPILRWEKNYYEKSFKKVTQILLLIHRYNDQIQISFLIEVYDLCYNYGVDFETFIRLIIYESGFNPNAVSSMGAIGLCQLIRSTAAFTAKRHGIKNYNLFNPIDNVTISLLYLRDLLNIHCDNYRYVCAEYLGGLGYKKYINSSYVKNICVEEVNFR